MNLNVHSNNRPWETLAPSQEWQSELGTVYIIFLGKAYNEETLPTKSYAESTPCTKF